MKCIWPEVTTDLTLYQGHLQTVQYSAEKQECKNINQVKIYDKFRIGEKIDGDQRTYCIGGEGRTGNVGEIKAWNLKGCNVWGRFYRWPQTTKWSKGSVHEEKSASGLNSFGLIRAYDAIINNICLIGETSNKESPLSELVLGQKEGVNLNWDDLCRKYPKDLRGLHLENFEKTKEQKREFEKLYPFASKTEDLLICTPGRETSMANLDESLGLGISGNLGEFSFLTNDDIRVVTYQECRKNLEDRCIGEKLKELTEENVKTLRESIPQLLDQRNPIERLCEAGTYIYENRVKETPVKRKIFYAAEGPRSRMLGDAFLMRGGHGKQDQPENEAMRVDSVSRHWVRMEVESMKDEEKEKSLAIAISESLKTDSKHYIKYLMNHDIPTFLFTSPQNKNHKLVKSNENNTIFVPNLSVHELEIHYYKVSSFHRVLLPLIDSIASRWIGGSVVKKHKTV